MFVLKTYIQQNLSVEHDGAQWVWWWTEGSPRNVQSGTVGTWRRFKGHILYPL